MYKPHDGFVARALGKASAKAHGLMSTTDKVKLDSILDGAKRLATATLDGLMSAADKAKLDAINRTRSVDANGWTVTFEPSGKRVWYRKWTGIATGGGVSQFVVQDAPLPVGVASHAALRAMSANVRLAAFAENINATILGSETTTTFSVVARNVTGSAMNANNTTIDLMATLVEA